MSNWKLIRLNFGQTPAHFGEVGIGLEESRERVRSDTLFSALISSYARLFGTQKVEELLGNFQQSPCFRLSSTFIYRYQKLKYTYYLPKPLAFPKKYPIGNDLEFTKTYKKLSYLPLEVWQRWYQGEGFTDSDRLELIHTTNKTAKDNDPLHKAGTFDYNQAFKIDKNPKVAIDRTTRSTNFYHTGFVHFESHPNEDKSKPENHSGLYFILHFPTTNPHLEKEIQATLIFLGEEGLGGERSSGAGRFKMEWLDLTPEWKKVVQHQQSNYCLISLFWDDYDSISPELLNHGACYDIQERGGWIASSPSGYQKRRKMVRMFTEGSVFSACPQGKLANVTPERFKDHQVYRSGVSLSLPISINS
ncbi:CRISPR-associated RAMP protein, Csm4 family [Planktothrix sp. PCC 11201]|uniref:type III-A CRISPR-associated RAMP protein Csm4 n=1 Tax=Planktothrix sp. PCC 11201 TaxID=1729650 RepID=UPI00091A13DA|nr:type III-A CRISPR-associated RAMP protein Csm4 [Planktothrix sp. PCC 11201]SKB15257.1 CRISPR-associated RAMP protein, Csm4 family [Planktothrix sp. PCC 11201]